MTSIDYLPLLTEVFGPPLTEPSKTPHTRRFGDGSFSGSTTNGQWFEWHDGELIRSGSIEELHSLHTEIKANGGGDLRAVLAEWDRGGIARIRDKAAAIIREILLGRRTPRQGKYGNRRLHLGWTEIDVAPNESAEEIATRAIEALNEELEPLGVKLPCFENGRLFTEEEIAHARAALPPAEEELEPTTEPPANSGEPEAASNDAPQPDPASNEAADLRRRFLENVLPWDVEGLCSIHWHRPESPFQGRSYKTIEKILVAAELLSKLQTNIYFCLSRHSGRRLQETATALRAIWFDIDVDETGKDPKKYATLEEAIAAFWIFARLSASPIRAGWWLRVAAFMSIGSTLERFRSKNGNHMPKGSKQRPASGG